MLDSARAPDPKPRFLRALGGTPTTIVVGFFAVVCGFETLSLYMSALRHGQTPAMKDLFGTWISWVVQVPLLFPMRLLTRRLRLAPRVWPSRLPIYLLAGVLYTLLEVIATLLIYKSLGWAPGALGPRIWRSFTIFLPSQFAIFTVIAGILHALDYMQESEQRERERERLAASLTETRLHALRSQLSPHFFFNTLNAISTFSLQGRQDRVGRMVGGLGDLVRVSLDSQLPHEVPLARELVFLELYLDIQRVRFEDWLRIEQQVDPAASEVLVPSLMLQPLVENAIEHGVAADDGLHHVRIGVALDGDALRIEIENPGVDGELVIGDPPRIGVGLRNTAERLEQLHPGAHTFAFGPTLRGGFLVTVRFPARRAPADAAAARESVAHGDAVIASGGARPGHDAPASTPSTVAGR